MSFPPFDRRQNYHIALLEPLEERQFLSAVPLASKIKVAQVTDNSGNPLDESRVTVRFSQAITLGNTSDFRMFGYAIETATGSGKAQIKTTIHILSVTPGADGNKLIFTTDRRVRKGAELEILAGGVSNTSDNSDIGAQAVKLPAGLNKERFTLACRAFVPTNLVFFDPILYPTATALNATPTEPSTGTVTTQLTNYLDAEVAAGTITSAQETSALAVYNDPNVTSEVPAPNMRAGLASLTGTITDSAIAQYTTGENVTGKPFTVVDFSSEVSNAATIAETTGNTTTKRDRTLFKPSYEGESFLALAPILAHEAVRQDLVGANPSLPDGINESEVAVTFETMVWAQELLINPAPASAHTALATHLNEDLLAMLNSGLGLFPRVGELAAPILGGNVFPKSATPSDGMGAYTSFENYVRRTYTARGFADAQTPGNPYAQTVDNIITGRSDAGTYSFSSSLIVNFDNSQQIITDTRAVALAHVLRLKLS